MFIVQCCDKVTRRDIVTCKLTASLTIAINQAVDIVYTVKRLDSVVCILLLLQYVGHRTPVPVVVLATGSENDRLDRIAYVGRCNHSLTAARNRLWVVAPSMLTGHQQEPMRQQQ